MISGSGRVESTLPTGSCEHLWSHLVTESKSHHWLDYLRVFIIDNLVESLAGKKEVPRLDSALAAVSHQAMLTAKLYIESSAEHRESGLAQKTFYLEGFSS